MRSPSGISAAALVLLAVAFVALNVAATFHRSLIPIAVDGTVTGIEVRREKHPGIDDVWLVTIGDRRLHVDAPIGRALGEGARVTKTAWAQRLVIDGTPRTLALSRDARAMLAVMPLTLLVAGAALHLNRRSAQ